MLIELASTSKCIPHKLLHIIRICATDIVTAEIQEISGLKNRLNHRHEALSRIPVGAIDADPSIIEGYVVGREGHIQYRSARL
ncbi:MAG: hypothetical protein A3208_03270 [Candidatus Methanoprimaticola hominis]|nr:MAG: hypothetical protein A3208_03270 [Methanomassiliicoccales archaeon Mx-06]